MKVAIKTPSLYLTPSIHGPSMPFCEIKQRMFTSSITLNLSFTFKQPQKCVLSKELCFTLHMAQGFSSLGFFASSSSSLRISCGEPFALKLLVAPDPAKRRSTMHCRPITSPGPWLNTRPAVDSWPGLPTQT